MIMMQKTQFLKSSDFLEMSLKSQEWEKPRNSLFCTVKWLVDRFYVKGFVEKKGELNVQRILLVLINWKCLWIIYTQISNILAGEICQVFSKGNGIVIFKDHADMDPYLSGSWIGPFWIGVGGKAFIQQPVWPVLWVQSVLLLDKIWKKRSRIYLK